MNSLLSLNEESGGLFVIANITECLQKYILKTLTAYMRKMFKSIKRIMDNRRLIGDILAYNKYRVVMFVLSISVMAFG